MKKDLEKSHKNLIQFPKFGSKFKIIHSSKDVEYTVDQFLEKNMDEIPQELIQVFQNSKNPLIKELFEEEEKEE